MTQKYPLPHDLMRLVATYEGGALKAYFICIIRRDCTVLPDNTQSELQILSSPPVSHGLFNTISTHSTLQHTEVLWGCTCSCLPEGARPLDAIHRRFQNA